MKIFDVSVEWGKGMTVYALGDEIPESVEHFVDTCMSKLMRTDRRVVFDMSNMTFSPSIQMTYIIAYRLVEKYEFKKVDLRHITLLDSSNHFLPNIFTQAVLEALVDFKVDD